MLGASCMTKVFIYGFTGTFTESSEYDYDHPLHGDTHKCMLFLRQNTQDLEFQIAQKEAEKYGFSSIINLSGNELKVDVLNSDSYKGFVGYYEEALQKGSSLVYYPRT